jgi:hypothetical protein
VPSSFKTEKDARQYAARAFRRDASSGPSFSKPTTVKAAPDTDKQALEKRDRAYDEARKGR